MARVIPASFSIYRERYYARTCVVPVEKYVVESMRIAGKAIFLGKQ